MDNSKRKLLKQQAKTRKAFAEMDKRLDDAIAANKLDGTISSSVLDDVKDMRIIAQNVINTVQGNELRTPEELSADVERQTQELRKKQACKHTNWTQKPDKILTIRVCNECGEKVYH
jgi:hypothetical protein